jgi:hypothetical protein
MATTSTSSPLQSNAPDDCEFWPPYPRRKSQTTECLLTLGLYRAYGSVQHDDSRPDLVVDRALLEWGGSVL